MQAECQHRGRRCQLRILEAAGRAQRFRRQHAPDQGQPYTVIGISPKGFCGASALIAPDIWLPLGVRSQLGSTLDDSESMRDLNGPKVYALNLVGRMRPGGDDRVGEIAAAGDIAKV